MKLKDIDKWLEETKTERDKEYEEAIKETATLDDIEELDEEEDL